MTQKTIEIVRFKDGGKFYDTFTLYVEAEQDLEVEQKVWETD